MRLRISFLLAAACLSAGCASIFNPYSSKFQCPETEKGKCVSVASAYEESVGVPPTTTPPGKEQQKKGGPPEKEAAPEGVPEKLYEKALFNELTGLIEDPKTPMVAPPQVVRVLLLPYQGEENELFMLRYIYFFVDEHKWILGDYLRQPKR